MRSLFVAAAALGCADLGHPMEPDAGAGPGLDAGSVVVVVVMRDMRFQTAEGAALAPIRARRGDVIRFRNDEPTYVRHRVADGVVVGNTVSAPRHFDSDLLDPGQSFDYVVAAPPGRVPFVCTTHPSTMKDGEVWVD